MVLDAAYFAYNEYRIPTIYPLMYPSFYRIACVLVSLVHKPSYSTTVFYNNRWFHFLWKTQRSDITYSGNEHVPRQNVGHNDQYHESHTHAQSHRYTLRTEVKPCRICICHHFGYIFGDIRKWHVPHENNPITQYAGYTTRYSRCDQKIEEALIIYGTLRTTIVDKGN